MAAVSTFGQGIARGMRVTLEHFFKPKITVQYPEEKVALAPRFRGAPVWAFDEGTGRARCVGCGLCVQACPMRAIEMSHEFELSQYERYDLVYTREEWLGRKKAPLAR